MTRLVHGDGAVKAVSHERWRTLSRCFLDHNYQHTWAYADALARRRHATSEHVEIVSEGETLGLASVRIRSLSLLGGGVAKAGSLLFAPLDHYLRGQLSPAFKENLRILPARFGNEAGIVGAATLALEEAGFDVDDH